METELPTNNLQILKLQWSENLKSSIIKIIIFTIVLFIGLLALFTFSNFEEIIKNWSRYRCNPAFMPMAGLAGYDATDNFKFCLNSVFGDKAKELFAPIFGIIANFVQILKLIIDASLGMRQMFGRFFLGMNSYIRNVRDRIQALMFQVRLSFLKLQNLMGRVYATMFSVVFMGMSAVTAGLNLSENSLVKFVLDFCFAPETPVRMKDGTIKPISEIQIGDALEGGGIVTSVFRLTGSGTPMVYLDGVHVSAEHLVEGPNKSWILAKEHPNAMQAPSIPTLICLNVDTHIFSVGNGLQVRDYDETEEAHVVKTAQELAETALNGYKMSTNTYVKNYSLGFSPSAFVLLEDQKTWKLASEVELGTRLYGGNEVLGIVQELCEDVGTWEGVSVSAAQLIENKGCWKRTAHLTQIANSPQTLLQFITRHVRPIAISLCGHKKANILWIRDYREAPLPEMETVYRDILAQEKID